MPQLVLRTDSDGCTTLTLNRPEKLNALNGQLFGELRHHIDALAHDDSIELVILRGAGRAFSAGNDLNEIAAREPDAPQAPPEQGRIVESLGLLPQPVIAAVHGHCVTGGLELALGADIIVAAESARFRDTHGLWGLAPKWGLSQRLPRRVGYSRALEMMITSRVVTGAEAVQLGLAEFCYSDNEFDARLNEMTASILAGSGFSHRGFKRLLSQTEGLSLSAGLALEFMGTPGTSPDSRERIAAFVKK